MTTAQLRGSAAPSIARRWPASSGVVLRFAPISTTRGPASLRRGGSLNGHPPCVASQLKPVVLQSFTTMCMKAEYTSTPSTPTSHITSAEHAENDIQDPTSVVTANEEMDMNKDQELAPQQNYAKIHDFCLGIPFGGILFSMGLVGFLFWRSPVSLTFGVAPGLAILALGVLSLKVWRSGRSSWPLILAQAAVAAAVAWKHCQAYTSAKKLLPWGFYAALSAAMVCFYSYVLLAGGNPPPKKAAAAR